LMQSIASASIARTVGGAERGAGRNE